MRSVTVWVNKECNERMLKRTGLVNQCSLPVPCVGLDHKNMNWTDMDILWKHVSRKSMHIYLNVIRHSGVQVVQRHQAGLLRRLS